MQQCTWQLQNAFLFCVLFYYFEIPVQNSTPVWHRGAIQQTPKKGRNIDEGHHGVPGKLKGPSPIHSPQTGPVEGLVDTYQAPTSVLASISIPVKQAPNNSDTYLLRACDKTSESIEQPSTVVHDYSSCYLVG